MITSEQRKYNFLGIKMYKYISCLLTFGVVVSSAMLLKPCYAETVNPSSDSDITSLENTSAVSQPNLESENNSNKDKAVSQASPGSETVKNPNPRIPIGSRVFPSMQQ